MNIQSIIVAILIVALCIHELRLWKKTKVYTCRTKSEIIIIIIAILVFAGLAIKLANMWIHYVLLVFAILFVFADIFKQGIAEDGVIIATRGKSFFTWNEIHHIELKSNRKVELVCYSDVNSVIAKQYYDESNLDKLKELLANNDLI